MVQGSGRRSRFTGHTTKLLEDLLKLVNPGNFHKPIFTVLAGNADIIIINQLICID